MPIRRQTLPCLTTILTALTVTNVNADADGPDYWGVTGVAADDVLNIRAEASPKSAKVGTIPPGANCVRNLGCSGGLTLVQYMELSEAEQAAAKTKHPRWCEVEYQGQRGWVAGRYLAEEECAPKSGMAPMVDQ